MSAPASTNGPRTNSLSAQNILSHTNLLSGTGLVWHSDTTVGVPGGEGELKTPIITITRVDGPVAAGFALSDGVPVRVC